MFFVIDVGLERFGELPDSRHQLKQFRLSAPVNARDLSGQWSDRGKGAPQIAVVFVDDPPEERLCGQKTRIVGRAFWSIAPRNLELGAHESDLQSLLGAGGFERPIASAAEVDSVALEYTRAGWVFQNHLSNGRGGRIFHHSA